MLEKFTVSNYKNFKDPISIDFKDVKDYKFNQDCLKDKLISKAIIYGKNGSGKTNFGYALFDIVAMLTDKNIDSPMIDTATFLNADSSEKEARFSYEFRFDDTKVKYTYFKTEPRKLASEELIIDNNLIFSFDYIRSTRQIENLDNINAQYLNFDYFDNNISALKYIANNTQQTEQSIIRKLINFVSSMLLFRHVESNHYVGLINNVDILTTWIAENGYTKDFENFLKERGHLNITLKSIKAQGSDKPDLFEVHKNKKFHFQSIASAGTHALTLFYYWYKHFDKASFLYIDEFDANYHYKLSVEIVKLVLTFTNLQAIITTHSPYVASNDLLRPDCYFVLNKGKLKSFANSTDRELREGHNLEKILKNEEFDDWA